MRIGVSNLLFTPDHDDAVAALLNRRGIDTIDITPSRYFDPASPVERGEWQAIARRWQARGIAISGLQSLLFGIQGATLFGDREARARLSARVLRQIEAADALGAAALVFGSWQNRRRGERPLADAMALAAETFRPLARAAAARGLVLTIEPIYAGYGNDFLVDHLEAIRFIDEVAEPGFGLTLDVGCLGLAGESIDAVLPKALPHLAHIQLAEHKLAPLDPANPWHAQAGPTLRTALAGRVACIEALPPVAADPLAAIEQSLDVACEHYG